MFCLLPPPPTPQGPNPELPRTFLSHTPQASFPVTPATQTHSPLGQAERSPWLQGRFCYWKAERKKWDVGVGGECPGLYRLARRYDGVFWMVGRALVPEPAPSRPKALTVFFLQEAGSTCSSSVSDDISDSDELLLESLPSSEDDPSPCPSGAFFLFFIFLFSPSSSLCPLEDKEQMALRPRLNPRLASQKSEGGELGQLGPLAGSLLYAAPMRLLVACQGSHGVS